jgi:hypothetical protein
MEFKLLFVEQPYMNIYPGVNIYQVWLRNGFQQSHLLVYVRMPALLQRLGDPTLGLVVSCYHVDGVL